MLNFPQHFQKHSIAKASKGLLMEYMGESSKFPKSRTVEIQILKLAGGLQKCIISSLND